MYFDMIPPADGGRDAVAGDAVVSPHVCPLNVCQLQGLAFVAVHNWNRRIYQHFFTAYVGEKAAKMSFHFQQNKKRR